MKKAKNKRHCGDCKACCVAYPIDIEEFTKPEQVPCQHLTDRGCGIYASRPELCRDFECLWLQGLFPGSDRSDRLGVVFQNCSATGYPDGGVITATELYAGAFETRRAKQLIDDIAGTGMPLVEVSFDYKTNGRGVLADKRMIAITRK